MTVFGDFKFVTAKINIIHMFQKLFSNFIKLSECFMNRDYPIIH